MSFSCSLHRWTQTCWLAGFFGSILIFFVFAEKLKANAPSLHQRPANWCSVTSRTATARRKIGKSLKKLSNKTLKLQSTSAIQLFLHFNVFYDESSEHELTVSGSFFKTLSPHSCSKEKNALMGLKWEFSDEKNKQSCCISQLNWLLMFLNILNVSVYVLNLTFFFLFSETEDFFISRLGLNNNTTETNRSMRDVYATLAGHVTPPGVYEWTGKSCHVLPISHTVKYACVFSCGGVGRGLKSTLTSQSYKTYIYRLKIFLYESDRQTLLPYLWACAILTYSQTYMISDTAEVKQINVTTLRLLSLCFCDFVLDVCSNAETLQSATTRTLCRHQRVAAAGKEPTTRKSF